jgi:hypothetical protein
MSIHCPIPGQVTSVRTPLLFHDEAIVLGSEEIYLEDVSTPTIVGFESMRISKWSSRS